MIGAISTALTGLLAASKRVAASAENIANISSVGSLEPGGKEPYRGVTTVQTTSSTGGTSAQVIPKSPGIVGAYAPDSPFANADGMIAAPDVDLAEEAVNMKLAEIAYKANITTIKTADEMSKALDGLFDKKV